MSELDCWEGLGSNRTSEQSHTTRIEVVEHYGLDKKKQCQILGESDHVVNAHIFPKSRSKLLVLLDLKQKDVDSPRNILRIHNDIEKAFDKKEIMFEFDAATTSFTLKVMNTAILETRLQDRSETFRDIHGKILNIPNGNLPFRRLMAIHSFYVRQKWSMDMNEAEIRTKELLSFSVDGAAQARIASFLKPA